MGVIRIPDISGKKIAPVIIEDTTVVPLNYTLAMLPQKTLTSNDVYTYSNGSEGCGAQVVLVGDGTHIPDFTAFHQKSGDYDATTGVKNLITFEFVNGEGWVSIINGTAI